MNNLPSFTFDDLIAILDPENECAHSWKKKIDLGAGTITFYELDLQSVVPRLSQYVRIQRQISKLGSSSHCLLGVTLIISPHRLN